MFPFPLAFPVALWIPSGNDLFPAQQIPSPRLPRPLLEAGPHEQWQAELRKAVLGVSQKKNEDSASTNTFWVGMVWCWFACCFAFGIFVCGHMGFGISVLFSSFVFL